MAPDDPLRSWLLLRHFGDIARTARVEQLVATHAALSQEVRRGLAAHAEVLRSLLAQEGLTDEGPLLRELACLTPGEQRGRPGTLQRIWFDETGQPSRHLREAESWWKRSMSAVREARLLSATEAQRLTEMLGMPLALRADAVEVLRALERGAKARLERPEDGSVTTLSQLTSAEARVLASELLVWLDGASPSRRRLATDTLHALACVVPGALAGVHSGLVERGLFYPSELFHQASVETGKALLERLEASGDAGSRARMAEALAWVDCADVHQTFARWQRAAPAWMASLGVSAEHLARAAGWAPGPQGEPRPLCRPEAWRLVSPGVGNPSDAEVVRVVAAHDASCGWCHRELILLLDLSSRALRLLGMPGHRLRVATCEVCGMYAPVFTDFDLEGGSQWSRHNGHLDAPDVSAYDPLPRERLVLGPRCHSVLEARASERWQQHSASVLGGHPAWVQRADYPACPGCQQAMPFLGQVDLGGLGEPREGTFYAFVCSGCSVAATMYQQT